MGSAAVLVFEQMTKRADFLAAARSLTRKSTGFILQGRRRTGPDAGHVVRVGFTCSKKVGNAVARNRAKRRLREIARLELPNVAKPGWDYVLIGRRDVTASLPFDTLRGELVRAVRDLSQ